MLGARNQHQNRAPRNARSDQGGGYLNDSGDGNKARDEEDPSEFRRRSPLRGDDLRSIPRFEIGGIEANLSADENRVLR